MNLPSVITEFLKSASWAAPNTIENYRLRLHRFSEFVAGRQLTTALILEYKASFRALKESSAAAHFMTLRLFLTWAVRMNHLPQNPMPDRLRFVVAKPTREPITADEWAILIAAAESVQPYAGYWPNAIRLAWHTGLRLSDVALLKRASLNIPGSALKLTPKKTKRHAVVVEIPIPRTLTELLTWQSNGEYVFPEMASHYRRDGHKTLSAQFCHIARKAGVRKGFHCFRHAFISRHLDAGVMPTLVSEMTGINLAQIMTYAHSDLETKRAALGLATKKESAA